MWKKEQPAETPGAAVNPPVAPAPAAGRPEKNIMDLGKSVIIKGELSGSEDLTLFGQMEGSIKLSDHTLTIGPQADIKAAIFAKAVVIMGSVTGNVTAGQRVEIRATGSVIGDIVAPRIAIADGGSLRGKVEVRPSEADRPR